MLKSNKSAVVIIPPRYVWDKIQNIRRQYDKGFERWMPHINLVYPFKSDTEFSNLVPGLVKEFQQVEPFTVSFTTDSFGYFEHKQSCGMWLKPLLYSKHSSDIPENYRIHQKIQTVKNTLEIKSVLNPWTKNITSLKQECSICDAIPSSSHHSTPSIDNLRNAIWKPEDNVRMSNTFDVGLHNLKTAIWKPGECDVDSQSHVAVTNMSIDIVKTRPTENAQINNILNIKDIGNTNMSYEEELQLDKERDDSECFQHISMNNSKNPSSAESKFHPSVIEIQKLLENMYPDLNDLSTMSKHGYQPHLTLGQFKKLEVNQMMTNLKENWIPIEFKVEEIYLISRNDFKDPFEIREHISLG